MRWKGHLAATTAAAFPCTHFHTGNLIAHARFASTYPTSPSSAPFPFPAHRNPTPHQIFHLPSNASQSEIKARYYELARTFHPDSPASQALPSGVRHARLHAVASAYDILRGKKSHARPGQGGSADDAYTTELARRRRQHARRQAHDAGRTAPGYASEAGADDAWKDQVIIVVGLASLAVGFIPALLSLHTIPDARHRAASANLAQARAEARTFGDERRAAIRARVAEFECDKSREDSP